MTNIFQRALDLINRIRVRAEIRAELDEMQERIRVLEQHARLDAGMRALVEGRGEGRQREA